MHEALLGTMLVRVAITVLASTWFAFGEGSFPVTNVEPVSGITASNLARLVRQYADISPTHLSGTAADHATSEWISQQLSGLGLDVQYQPYVLPGPPLWIPEHDGLPSAGYGCQLNVDGQQIPCYVVQQPPLAPVALHDVPMTRVLMVNIADAYMFTAEQAYHRYLLANGTLPYDAVIVMNANVSEPENVSQPRPFDWNQSAVAPALVPVVTVSYGSWTLLSGATRMNSLNLFGHRIANVTSRNVLARPKGQSPEGCNPALGPALPFYIGTPIDGFFRAAGERGTGVAMLIALAQDFALRPPKCNVPDTRASLTHQGHRCHVLIFGFTSGHEQNDPGIRVGAIPYLQNLSAQLNVSLSEVPFVSVGASVGVYSRFSGENFAGQGSGTYQVDAVSSSHGLGSASASDTLDGVLASLGGDAQIASFVQVTPNVMNTSNTEGAVLQALLSGMSSMNLAGAGNRGRFHLPSDAGVDSVNITSLLSVAAAMSKALREVMCNRASSSSSEGVLESTFLV